MRRNDKFTPDAQRQRLLIYENEVIEPDKPVGWGKPLADGVQRLLEDHREKFEREIRAGMVELVQEGEQKTINPLHILFREERPPAGAYGFAYEVFRGRLSLREKYVALGSLHSHFYQEAEQLVPFPELATRDEAEIDCVEFQADLKYLGICAVKYRHANTGVSVLVGYLRAVAEDLDCLGDVESFNKAATYSVEQWQTVLTKQASQNHGEPLKSVADSPEDDQKAKVDLTLPPTASPPTAATNVYLTSWRKIVQAVGCPASQTNTFKTLAEKYDAPIVWPGGRGQKPKCEKGEVLTWWNSLAQVLEDERNQADGKSLQTYEYGKTGIVVPEIGGSVKRRRRDIK